MQGSEKSISLVQGGRSEYAAALAWEKGSSGPEEKTFSEWLESVKENPTVIDFKVRLKNIMGFFLKKCLSLVFTTYLFKNH